MENYYNKLQNKLTIWSFLRKLNENIIVLGDEIWNNYKKSDTFSFNILIFLWNKNVDEKSKKQKYLTDRIGSWIA